MKLYAIIESERAKKGQGGKELMIEIMGEDKEVVARIKVTRPPYIDYQINIYPVAYPNKLMLDVKGHGYRLKRIESKEEKELKGKRQKSEEEVHSHDWNHISDHVRECTECGEIDRY